jgi:hypothetical protein
VALALASCGGGGGGPSDRRPPLARLAPTAPMPLSPGNLDGQDEDPSILVARGGGALHAAWYSNRAGLHPSGRERKEIFATRSVDGVAWADPVQVTSDAEWSFYPSLAQGADGVFHLAWMRWRLLPDDCTDASQGCVGPQCCTAYTSRILYNRSSDGIAWNSGNELELADGQPFGFAELPSVVAASDGRLLVFFTSPSGIVPTWDVFVAVNDGVQWEPAVAVTGVNSATEHDTYPHVVERSPGSFLMTWTRWDPGVDPVVVSTTTKTMLSTSSDGLSWTTPVVASGPQTLHNVFPYLYPDHARQSWSVLWNTESGVFTLAADPFDPASLGTLDIPGYTPRVAPSPTPGIYWAAWAEFVGTAVDTQKIRHRFFAR